MGDDLAEARAHFKTGTDLYRRARYREALAEFQAAYKARPHGVIQYNIARSYEKLGDVSGALRSYRQYLRDVPEAEDRAQVLAVVSNLEKRLGEKGVQQLLVYSEPADAEVWIDGKVRGRTPFSAVLPHGTHYFALAKQGYRTIARDVVLTPDRSLELDLALQKSPGAESPAAAAAAASLAAAAPAPAPVAAAAPAPAAPPPITAAPSRNPPPAATSSPTLARASASAPEPPPARKAARAAPDLTPLPRPGSDIPLPVAPEPPAPRSRVWTWVAAGAAGAALAAAVYFGVSARNDQDALGDGTVRTKDEAQQLHDSAQSKAKTANILYGVAGAAGAAGVTLFFIEGSF